MPAISVERCIAGRELTEPRLHPSGEALAFVESAAGRTALMLHTFAGSPTRQLTSLPAPRAGRGMGGGCWCWTADGDAVVYVGDDGGLWLQPQPGGQVRQLTTLGPDRTVCAPFASPDGQHVVFVVDECEVWSLTLSDLSLARFDDGSADFCFDPYVTACSTMVLWQAWNVPDMPWDASRVERRTFDCALSDHHVPAAAIQQIRTMPDGTGISVQDGTGWLNLWIGDEPLVDETFEHAGPTWGMGQRSYAVSPDGSRVAFTRNKHGLGRLCVVDIASREVTEVARGVHGQLDWVGSRLSTLRSGARTPTQIAVYDTSTWDRTVVAIGPLSGWEQAGLAEPELIEHAAADGAPLFARLYRADESASPLLVWIHGGPTDQWQVTFMPRIAYWRAQGYHVLVPDHRGSTGHGRSYQQALRGRWGELDVSDVADAIAASHAAGCGTPASTAVVGASAGGFTALGVGARVGHLVAAVAVSSAVCDLADLTERSHRFERHYTETLVGSPVVDAQRYHDRSPINLAALLTGMPVLMIHGAADPVVPVEQGRAFVEHARRAGVSVDYMEYVAEGHGIRQPSNQLDEYRRLGDFLRHHLTGG